MCEIIFVDYRAREGPWVHNCGVAHCVCGPNLRREQAGCHGDRLLHQVRAAYRFYLCVRSSVYLILTGFVRCIPHVEACTSCSWICSVDYIG
jgi:hypothetical protein